VDGLPQLSFGEVRKVCPLVEKQVSRETPSEQKRYFLKAIFGKMKRLKVGQGFKTLECKHYKCAQANAISTAARHKLPLRENKRQPTIHCSTIFTNS